jgi:copper chaperone CopZ
MKTISIISAIFFVCVFGLNADAQKIKEAYIQTSAQCEMCKDRIESNMAFEKGIKDLNLDMETKKLFISFNTKKTDLETIKEAITKLGYDADDFTADQKAYKKLPTCCKKPKDRGNVSHE